MLLTSGKFVLPLFYDGDDDDHVPVLARANVSVSRRNVQCQGTEQRSYREGFIRSASEANLINLMPLPGENQKWLRHLDWEGTVP